MSEKHQATENNSGADSRSKLGQETANVVTFTTGSESGRFLGLEATRAYLFPDSSGPSPRSWSDWRAKGYFSIVKIGGRVFCDPSIVRAELTERFSIPAANR